jgi:hypothetical protein
LTNPTNLGLSASQFNLDEKKHNPNMDEEEEEDEEDEEDEDEDEDEEDEEKEDKKPKKSSKKKRKLKEDFDNMENDDSVFDDSSDDDDDDEDEDEEDFDDEEDEGEDEDEEDFDDEEDEGEDEDEEDFDDEEDEEDEEFKMDDKKVSFEMDDKETVSDPMGSDPVVSDEFGFSSDMMRKESKTWWESVSGMIGEKGLYKNSSVLNEMGETVPGMSALSTGMDSKSQADHPVMSFEEIAEQEGVQGVFKLLVPKIDAVLKTEKLERASGSQIVPFFKSMIKYLAMNNYLEGHETLVRKAVRDAFDDQKTATPDNNLANPVA